MNKKFQIFFILFLVTILCDRTHAMSYLTKGPFFLNIATKNLTTIFWSQPSRHYSHNKIPKNSFGIIDSFDNDQDSEHIKQITYEHHLSLVNPLFLDDKRDVWTDDIMPALHDKEIISKVYRLNGTTVGFVNYFIYEPWYKKTIPFLKEIGPTCTIVHLAVKNNYHNQGIGSNLLKSVIDDCSAQGVNKITLCTVGRKQEENISYFYKKFGFKIHQVPLAESIGDTTWAKRMGPNPFEVILIKIIEFLEEIDEW